MSLHVTPDEAQHWLASTRTPESPKGLVRAMQTVATEYERHAPRLVGTEAEVDALPVGAVLIDAGGVPWTKARRKRGGSGYPPEGWRSFVSGYYESSGYVASRGPLTVAYLPGVTS